MIGEEGSNGDDEWLLFLTLKDSLSFLSITRYICSKIGSGSTSIRRPSVKKRVIKMNKELHEAMMQQQKSFVEKFGREAGPDDPIFFDPDSDVPIPLSESKLRKELSEAARKAGLDVDRILSAFGFEDEEEVAKDF